MKKTPIYWEDFKEWALITLGKFLAGTGVVFWFLFLLIFILKVLFG